MLEPEGAGHSRPECFGVRDAESGDWRAILENVLQACGNGMAVLVPSCVPIRL